jgi:ribosomal protein S27E
MSIMTDSWRPYERGYHAVYHEHEVNHCPGCGRTQWIIGRVSAECAFCATALPLAEASMRGGPVIIQHKNRDMQAYAA